MHQLFGFASEPEFINYLCFTLLLLALASFVSLMFVNAPYGRYTATASKIYGFHMNGTLAWVLQEAPNLAWIPLCVWIGSAEALSSWPNRVLVFLFGLHYFQRTLIFPLLIRGGKPTPFVVFLLAFLFCVVNGYIQVRTLTALTVLPSSELYHPRFLLGVAVFFAGMAINIHSDHVLRNLRKPGDTNYYIPEGGMFTYVSGANFFGEILEWLGFAIACNSLAGFTFFFFTACNIGPRALHHHYWYKSRFGDKYPKSRKAVIPFVI